MDRKARIREYKETPRPMGIYRIRNTASGKVLIGTSRDLPSALNRQRAQLGMGAHPNRRLQGDWNAMGPDAFTIEILDTLSPDDRPDYDPSDDLRQLLSLWLEKVPASERYGG